MQSRNQRQDRNQENPVFFMCDEYQEIVSANKDGLSDLNFWDKSRSSKTIGIIFAQSVSSFYFRNLSSNHAVALLSIKGQSMDDVLKLLPLFLDKETP